MKLVPILIEAAIAKALECVNTWGLAQYYHSIIPDGQGQCIVVCKVDSYSDYLLLCEKMEWDPDSQEEFFGTAKEKKEEEI